MSTTSHSLIRIRINTAAVIQNIAAFKAYIAPKTPKLWAVVKANAYGHDLKQFAKLIHDEVDGFCVASMDEALSLRDLGLTEPILVLSVVAPSDAPLAVTQNISLAATSLDWLKAVLQTQPPKGLKIHLAFDSGMGRLGVLSLAELEEMIQLARSADFEIEGIFTHFATADEDDLEKFLEQENTFQEVLSKLSIRPSYRHSTNSGAGLWHTDAILDLERIGILLYGLDPSDGLLALPYPLTPVMELTTELIQVKKMPVGSSVGYGACAILSEDSFIGVLPIGYADGWSREMTGFHVLISGHLCDIIGPISMNMCMVKLPKNFPIGQNVTLIGTDGAQSLTVLDIAKWRHTISTEITSDFRESIPRIYD
ncbi:MAG: alanine racemase [Streptococcaceae bacterium]|jgi:alanine racemase|nr:alanine racemase [Streptococcaceae bacterium]